MAGLLSLALLQGGHVRRADHHRWPRQRRTAPGDRGPRPGGTRPSGRPAAGSVAVSAGRARLPPQRLPLHLPLTARVARRGSSPAAAPVPDDPVRSRQLRDVTPQRSNAAVGPRQMPGPASAGSTRVWREPPGDAGLSRYRNGKLISERAMRTYRAEHRGRAAQPGGTSHRNPLREPARVGGGLLTG
jgi:hypothetical protein